MLLPRHGRCTSNDALTRTDSRSSFGESSATSIHMGTLTRWIEVVRYESDFDSGGPAVMEPPN